MADWKMFALMSPHTLLLEVAGDNRPERWSDLLPLENTAVLSVITPMEMGASYLHAPLLNNKIEHSLL